MWDTKQVPTNCPLLLINDSDIQILQQVFIISMKMNLKHNVIIKFEEKNDFTILNLISELQTHPNLPLRGEVIGWGPHLCIMGNPGITFAHTHTGRPLS